MKMRIFQYQYEFPAKAVPPWSSQVERWYQLDAAAYGLVQVFSLHQKLLQHRPSMILLASAGASNSTDFEFASGGALSPSKFVHTLPSVRATPLLQVMGWQGPVLCLQNDPQTWLCGLQEACDLVTGEINRIWVLTARRKDPQTGFEGAALAEISEDNTVGERSQALWVDILKSGEVPALSQMQDADFWSWLQSDKKQLDFSISDRYRLRKHP